MSFYCYNQNNSGGSFAYDEQRGISHYVIIEANSASEADDRARGIGLYFDGHGDCSCCGDRWYPMAGLYGSNDSYDVPSIYEGLEVSPGEKLPPANTPEGADGARSHTWMAEGKAEGFIHYADGNVQGFWREREPDVENNGQYGWCVQFGRWGAQAFELEHNGYDKTGNRGQAPSGNKAKKGPEHLHDFKWIPPEKVTIEIKEVMNTSYGFGWFPTQEEAEAWAEEFKEYRRKARAAVRKVPKGNLPKNIHKVVGG